MAINFYSDEGINIDYLHPHRLRAWLNAVAEQHDCRIGNLCYQFCGDERILEVNRQFLDHDYYTDIITFDETRGRRLSGDMLISVETVASNADGLDIPFLDELHRVIIHGLLHLAGFGDKSPEEESQMRAAEDEALALLATMH